MNPIRRIAVWIPNLSRSSGGAEIYLLNLACILKEKFKVFLMTACCDQAEETVHRTLKLYDMPEFEVLYADDLTITDRSRFGEQLVQRETIQHQSIEKLLKEIDADLFINGTYGTLAGFEGIHNWHIVHFPQRPIDDALFQSHLKEYLNSYDHFLCNSEFTAQWFERFYGRPAEVLYPPVNGVPHEASALCAKENLILTCGRITPAKKLLELAHAFGTLYHSGIHDWRFVIAGLSDPSHEDYLNQLQDELNELPAQVVTDLPREALCDYYRKAKYYWHGMGLGAADDNPLKMEHFGMTTAEAMTAGCVPIVIDQGGQKEIVTAECGCRFSTEEELVQYTAALIHDPDRTRMLARNAIERSKRFSLDQFRKELERYLSLTG